MFRHITTYLLPFEIDAKTSRNQYNSPIWSPQSAELHFILPFPIILLIHADTRLIAFRLAVIRQTKQALHHFGSPCRCIPMADIPRCLPGIHYNPFLPQSPSFEFWPRAASPVLSVEPSSPRRQYIAVRKGTAFAVIYCTCLIHFVDG